MKREPPSIVSRAAKIFGSAAESGGGVRWVTWEECIEKWRTGWIKETVFEWSRFGSSLLAKTKGRPKSKCVLCCAVIFEGVSRRGNKIIVNEDGSFHNC